MRYRPFGRSGLVVSAVSLLLDGAQRHSAREWRNLVSAAMELGVNGFEFSAESPALIEGAGEALAEIERELLFISWRPRTLAAEPGETVEAFLARTGLGYVDLLSFDGSPPPAEPLQRLRYSRRARAFGLTGDDDETDLLITSQGFDALTTGYSPVSGWKDRNRLKTAAARDMAVIARDVWPEAMRPKKSLLGPRKLGTKAHPLAGIGGYRFLDDTPGWTAEEICMAYVLTEPAITTVRVELDRIDHLERLAEVPDRDLPTGVSAQIEMARFSAPDPSVARRA